MSRRRGGARWIGRAAALIGLIVLAGCATASLPSEMTTEPGTIAAATSTEPGYRQFWVGEVVGGSKTNPLWMSNVASEDFRVALEASLRGLDFLAADQTGAKLRVTAFILDLEQPLVGLDITVTTTIRYVVAPMAGGQPVFDDAIASSGTASLGSALLGSERVRKANEAAVRANIQSFVERLRLALKSSKSPAA